MLRGLLSVFCWPRWREPEDEYRVVAIPDDQREDELYNPKELNVVFLRFKQGPRQEAGEPLKTLTSAASTVSVEEHPGLPDEVDPAAAAHPDAGPTTAAGQEVLPPPARRRRLHKGRRPGFRRCWAKRLPYKIDALPPRHLNKKL